VLSVGSGDSGQLGLGADEKFRLRKKPALVRGLLHVQVVQLAAGALHSVALAADGGVFTWGCNDDGALGRVTEEMSQDGDTSFFWPARVLGVDALLMPGERVVAVDAGDSHSLALTSGGRVLGWGTFKDANGTMGFAPHADRQALPVVVEGFDRSGVVAIAAGDNHDLALTRSGVVYTWGDVGFGHRLSARSKQQRLLPRPVRLPMIEHKKPRALRVFAGGYLSFVAVEMEGVGRRLLVWGPNNYGQCGTGDTSDVLVPTVVQTLNGVDIVSVASGLHHTLVLDAQGCVWAFGRGHYGRLGMGDEETRLLPMRIPDFPSAGDRVVFVDAGPAHSLAVTHSGAVFLWGLGNSLALGNGEDREELKPCRLAGQQVTTPGIMGACGAQHSLVLVEPRLDAIAAASAPAQAEATAPRAQAPSAPDAPAPGARASLSDAVPLPPRFHPSMAPPEPAAWPPLP
jgi:regulator of chromosome condensation